MKRLILRFMAVIMIMVSFITLCGCETTPFKIGTVQIESLSAKAANAADNEEEVSRSTKSLRRLSQTTDDETVPLEEVNDSQAGQYIIIYGCDEISFTVKLDNPKAEAIDAIELMCDDSDAEILVDGKFEKLNYSNGKRVMNWAQENPYEKTFIIKTTAQVDLNKVVVTDIKVNGEWQNKDLNNDTLNIYKLYEAEISGVAVSGVSSFVNVKFTHSDNIEIIVDDDTKYNAENDTYTFFGRLKEHKAETVNSVLVDVNIVYKYTDHITVSGKTTICVNCDNIDFFGAVNGLKVENGKVVYIVTNKLFDSVYNCLSINIWAYFSGDEDFKLIYDGVTYETADGVEFFFNYLIPCDRTTIPDIKECSFQYKDMTFTYDEMIKLLDEVYVDYQG